MDDEFITPMQQSAGAMKELYDAYIHAGFTKTQAMDLVIAGLRQNQLQNFMLENNLFGNSNNE